MSAALGTAVSALEARRRIGASSLMTGALGLGCNRLIDPGNADLERVVHRALDLGVVHFDGADLYGDGRCELFLGQALRSRRDAAVVVTKFGAVRRPDGTPGLDGRPDYVRAACEASLKRLGMETIDLYYLHRPDPAIPIEETIGAMAGLVSAGKVRALGVCNLGLEDLRRAHATHRIDAVQIEYSLMSRSAEADLLPACRERGITVVGYGPLTYSFLAGAKTQEDLGPANNPRRRQSRFADENFAHNARLLADLDALCGETGASRAQVALAWCLARPWDIVPIPGATKIPHLEENVAAASLRLNPAQVRRLDEAFAPSKVRGGRE